MRAARALLRLAALVPLTVALCAVNVLVSRTPVRRSLFLHRWARVACRILGVRISQSGEPPARPFLMACNHLGYVDIVVLASRVPCVFVAKSEIARWRVLGPPIRSMGTIFVDREHRTDLSRVVGRMVGAVTSGAGVAFFPEGTSSAGDAVLPFRSSLFEAAARTGYPVSCASLRYRTREGDPPVAAAVAWWGDMAFGGHFWRFLGLRAIDAELRFAPETVSGGDRKDLARAARDVVVRTRDPGREGSTECASR